MKLIINSDDFGISRGVNYGVIDAYNQGVLSSTTALVCSKEIEHACELAKQNPGLGVGLHLAFDFLESLSKNKELADEFGNLYTKTKKDPKRDVDVNIILEEWELQYNLFLKIFQKKPTHFDSHHHVHIFNKSCQKAIIIMAEKYELPVRGLKIKNTNSTLNGEFYDNTVSFDNLKKYILDLEKSDNSEICLHNAFCDEDLIAATTYNTKRMKEHKVLTSNEFKQFLRDHKIILSKFEYKK